MKIFENLNWLRVDNSVIGLKSIKDDEPEQITTQKIYFGDYSSMFKFDLNKGINPMVGQNLYYLS